MTRETFKPYLKESRPLRIDFADGREISVRHGGYLALNPFQPQFLVWEHRGGFEFYDLSTVTAISVAGTEPTKG